MGNEEEKSMHGMKRKMHLKREEKERCIKWNAVQEISDLWLVSSKMVMVPALRCPSYFILKDFFL